MAYKTMLRQLISKWGIMSIDMQSAIDADMAVINEDGTKDYVDNDPDVITVEPIEKAEPEATEEAAEDVEAALFAADGEHGKDA